jgi:hypothetical protein
MESRRRRQRTSERRSDSYGRLPTDGRDGEPSSDSNYKPPMGRKKWKAPDKRKEMASRRRVVRTSETASDLLCKLSGEPYGNPLVSGHRI